MDSSHKNAKFPTMDDAVQFIFLVKKALLHTNDIDNKYNQFASALKLFDIGIISSDGLVQMLEHLFQGHENLIAGLKKFTPENQESKGALNCCEQEEDFGYKSEWAASKEFLDNVKDRFKGKIGVYEEFLDVLNNYRRGRLAFRRVYEKTFSLLFGHTDLLCQFEYFWNQDGKVREEMESTRLSLIEDHLCRMDVLIGNLQSATLSMKKVMDGCGSEQENLTARVRCFEKLYGEVMANLPVALMRPDPTRDFGLRALRVHPMKDFGLRSLMKKEEEICQIRSKFNEFLKEYHKIRCRRQ